MFASSIKVLFILCFLHLTSNLFGQIISQKAYEKVKIIENISSTGSYEQLSQVKKAEIDSAITWLSDMTESEEFQPHLSWVYANRGRLNYKIRDIETAKLDLEKSLEIDPLNYQALERLCVMSMWHLKGYTKRRILINISVEKMRLKVLEDSLSASSWYSYAKFLDLDKEFSNANNTNLLRKAWLKAAMLSISNHDAWYELSLLYSDEPEQRLRYLLIALSIQESWLYRDHIVSVLTRQILDDEKSLKFLDESLEIYKMQPTRYETSILFYLKQRAAIYKRQNQTDLYKQDLAEIQRIKNS